MKKITTLFATLFLLVSCGGGSGSGSYGGSGGSGKPQILGWIKAPDVSDIVLSPDETKAYVSVFDRYNRFNDKFNDPGLRVIDITQASNPRITAVLPIQNEHQTQSLKQPEDMTISRDGKTIYIIWLYALGLITKSLESKTYTIQEHDAPYVGGGNSLAISSDGKKIYTTARSNGGEYGYLLLRGIRDNKNMYDISSLDIPSKNSSSSDVEISKDNKTAYVIDSKFGLSIIDVSNEQNPKLLSQQTLKDPKEIAVSSDGKTAFATGYGVEIFDISNNKQPKKLSTIHIKTWDGDEVASRDVILSKDNSKLYVAAGVQGLRIYDVKDPKNPALLTSRMIDTKELSTYGSVLNDIALSKDGTKIYGGTDFGFVIIDVRGF